jgi:hypothetical protein
MIDLMQQFEVRAILAQKDREARSALRASEAKGGRSGLTARFAGHLARLGIGAKREAARLPHSGA